MWAYYILCFCICSEGYSVHSSEHLSLHLWKILVISLFYLKYCFTPLPLFMLSGTLILTMLKFIYLLYISLHSSLMWHLFFSLYSSGEILQVGCPVNQFTLMIWFFFYILFLCTIYSFDQYSITMCWIKHTVMSLHYMCLLHINECQKRNKSILREWKVREVLF